MTKRDSPDLDKRNWRNLYNAMECMVRTQHAQLDYLLQERKILQDRIVLENERWVSDVKLLQGEIDQMRDELTAQKVGSVAEAAEWEVILGIKELDIFLLKDKCEKTSCELKDLRKCIEIQSSKISRDKGVSDKMIDGVKNSSSESELRRQSHESRQLLAKKDIEISKLVAEKSFVWNQYNKLENDTRDQLKQKCIELDIANKKMESLVKKIEELGTSNLDLRNQISKMEGVCVKQNGEISRLSSELQSLKKNNNDHATPKLKPCSTRSGPSMIESTGMNGKSVIPRTVAVKNPPAPVKRTGNSKRNVMDNTSELKCYATRSMTLRSRTTNGMSGKGEIAMTVSVKSSPKSGNLKRKVMDDTTELKSYSTRSRTLRSRTTDRMNGKGAIDMTVLVNSSPGKAHGNLKRKKMDDTPAMIGSLKNSPSFVKRNEKLKKMRADDAGAMTGSLNNSLAYVKKSGNSKRKLMDDTTELKSYSTRSRTLRSRTTDRMNGKGAIDMTVLVNSSPGKGHGNFKRKQMDDTPAMIGSLKNSPSFVKRNENLKKMRTDGARATTGSLNNSLAYMKRNGHSRKRMDDTPPPMTVLTIPLKTSPASVKRNGNLKSNQMDDSPRLFTSSFQIPKLKISSPQVG
ncbi:unnamed protein product [Cuscuta europaea]|uniref:Uncharacterized protein n=1 Tax=Cuscuta europaea TaxID=41803 RepID=A0A9P0YH41_CUSEU|nr:unnamed protein product [Cuscuta europaea]